MAIDGVAAQCFAGLGMQHGTNDDFRLAVAGQVARGRVQNVFRIRHADGDERVAQALAKAFAEHHHVFAVNQHALGPAIASHIGHEVEARLARNAAIFLVKRVDAIEQLIGRRRTRRGRSRRLIALGRAWPPTF